MVKKLNQSSLLWYNTLDSHYLNNYNNQMPEETNVPVVVEPAPVVETVVEAPAPVVEVEPTV